MYFIFVIIKAYIIIVTINIIINEFLQMNFLKKRAQIYFLFLN